VLFLLALFLLSSLFVIVSRMPSRRPASIMRGCAAAPHQLAHLLADLRPEDLQTHMEYLSDDLLEGRGTGTRGEVRSRQPASQPASQPVHV
jgi:hypothetical protein